MEKPPRQLALFTPPESTRVTHIIKRDGRVVGFNKLKIVDAIYRAAVSVGGRDRELAEKLADKAVSVLHHSYPPDTSFPSVEEIQDIVEKILMENGHAKTAKAFILYRAERRKLRSRREETIVVEDNIPYKVLWKVFTWNVDHGCESAAGLNKRMAEGTWTDLIQASERVYHDEIQIVADRMTARLPELRLVIVAGPSSSGKTTTTTKIGEKLRARGVGFALMNLDNYFKDLVQHPKDEYGDYDFERPEALDLDLINDHLARLLRGETIPMPIYSFKKGVRENETKSFKLESNQILLIDSLHGLYEPMTQSVSPLKKFKFYIEAMCQVKDARGEFVRWADLRMLRRMVRDNWHRSYDPLRTVGHWHYVRRSEMRYIVPYIRSADYVFNGSLAYELPYYKRHLFPYFEKIIAEYRDDPGKTDAFIRAQRAHQLLESLTAPPDDSLVPSDSLLREFIGGSAYKY